MTLVLANQDLEKKLAKYKAQIRELKSQQQQQQQPQQEDGNDGLFDVLPRKQHSGSPEPAAETDDNLEDSMKKVVIKHNLFLNMFRIEGHNFCCEFQCDFLLLIDVKEWINDACAECMLLHQNIFVP